MRNRCVLFTNLREGQLAETHQQILLVGELRELALAVPLRFLVHEDAIRRKGEV